MIKQNRIVYFKSLSQGLFKFTIPSYAAIPFILVARVTWKNCDLLSLPWSRTLLEMPFTLLAPAHSIELYFVIQGLTLWVTDLWDYYGQTTIIPSWAPIACCSNLYSAHQFAYRSNCFFCFCHHPPFQIISSLMIGTVSYSFLCLSQNLPHSR